VSVECLELATTQITDVSILLMIRVDYISAR